MTKIRIELVLTDADADLIEYISRTDVPRATQFKNAMREKIARREEEQFDERVKRLLGEALKEQRLNAPPVAKVEGKKRLGFGAKKV